QPPARASTPIPDQPHPHRRSSSHDRSPTDFGRPHFRNTESSTREEDTMYYSSGNYEAFARPRKPEGVENKTAWLVGAGLTSMASAVFMIRDGQMPGDRITILERLDIPGGALDGIRKPEKGFVIRGGREMEDHMECLRSEEHTSELQSRIDLV